MLVWAPGLPGVSVAGALHQPLFAWLAQAPIARLSLIAACDDHTRGILLFQYPSEPADLNSDAGLASACVGRQWSQRTTIGGFAVWYAAPLG